MSDGERTYVGLTVSAWEKRNKQLEKWESSETNREPSYPLPRRTNSRVKFPKDVMFLAAVSCRDETEVERLLSEEGVDINCRNNDGLTAIHQCCIDDDLPMMKVVVKRGGDVNSVDNEGWTPLHAAASCGYVHIVKYLLECGAFPASVNNEGQTPSDLAEDYDEVIEVLQAEINRLGIDIEDIKCEEERQMLDDAKKLRNNPDLEPITSPGGATPLHVAAAKNYTTVLNVLLSIKELDINARDEDGWTPLHAAVHWESMEAAELLIFNGANVYAKTDAGEELDDLIDPDLEDELKELKKLNSYINPEQDQVRKRRSQVSSKRGSSSLVHSNSFENKYGPTHHGPIARRLSKEKLTMMDMKKEKEDLMHSFEKMEEINNSTSGSIQILSSSPIPSNESDHSSSNINNKSTGPPPMVRTNSFGGGGSNSPKNSRKKAELSRTMLERLNVFEAGGSSGGNTPNSPGGVSSPRTSTPVCSPPVNANGSTAERRKVEDPDLQPRARLNVMESLAAATQSNSSSGGSHKNRFSFQPKPVSGVSSQMSKTMSLDRSTFRETTSSSDSTVSLTRNHTPRTVVESKTPKKKEPPPATATPVNATPTTAMLVNATPTATSPATPTTTSTPIQEASSSSSASQTDKSDLSIDGSKDRSSSFATQPEAKRKSVAKNKRESRRSTQPIPTDLLERITKHDQMEQQQSDQTPNNAHTPDTISDSQTAKDPFPNNSSSVPKVITHSSSTEGPDTPTTPQPTTPKAATPTGKESTGAGDNSAANLSPQIPRTKSGARRKHKEKRRSTGIPTEVDGDCEIPDNLKGIVSHSRSGSTDSTDSNGVVVTNNFDIQGTEDTSINATTIEYYHQEMATLKKLLSEERKKNETSVSEYKQTCAKLEETEKDLSELRVKYHEVNSLLEKERSENETRDKKILQLEKSQRGIPELKAEIQRLKDENGALIRVVGKLSRAPINP